MSSKIELSPYNPNWPAIFKSGANLIKQALSENCVKIEHIGSTSVPNLIAKPKIDIMAVVKTIEQINYQQLANFEYEYLGELNIPFRLVFRKRTSDLKVNLHIYEVGDPGIDLHLMFRDYLRSDDKTRQKYANLKLEIINRTDLAAPNRHRIHGYTLKKDEFIKDVLRKTGFTGICLRLCTHDAEWSIYHQLYKTKIESKGLIYDYSHPSFTSETHFHFILYRGTEIIAIAHLEFLNDHKAVTHFISGEESYLKTKLERWVTYHHRQFAK